MSDKQKFAFDKVNFILLAIGMAIVIIGFLLMTGPTSSETLFEPDIFIVRRIKVAPVVCLFGFISMIYAVLRKPKTQKNRRIKMGDLTTFETIIIAIVEGLTEFLPVSSTGHMIITQNILGVESTEFVKAFTVIIQFGAILSVVCLYWKRFFRLNHTPAPAGASALKCFLHKFDFYWKLLVAFIPAAILGFLFSDKIDEMLESVAIVAVMLVIGGIFMLFCDKIFSKGSEDTVLTEKKAFNIGLFQCIAMIPGVSRSMATIVGGMAQKLTRKDAAEFSFFLAVPTMFAATGYKVLKLFLDGGTEILVNNMPALIIGNVVAFIVALLAIKFFISFVTKYGFKAFGWYRIIVGGTILVMLLLGYNLEIG